MKKSVTTDIDIIKAVSKKLKVEDYKVKKVLQQSISYMEQLTEEDGVYAINIPTVGSFMFLCNMFARDNYERINCIAKGNTYKGNKYLKFKVAEKKYLEIREREDKIKKESKYIKKARSSHTKKRFVNCIRGFLTADIEKIQNEKADEKNK